MLDITRFSHVNPEDKLNFVSGRGLPHRKSAMTKEERIGMAADLVTGKARLEPSLAQASWLMSVTPAQIRAELKGARYSEQERLKRLHLRRGRLLCRSVDCAIDRQPRGGVPGHGCRRYLGHVGQGHRLGRSDSGAVHANADGSFFKGENSNETSSLRARAAEGRAAASRLARSARRFRVSLSGRWLAVSGRGRDL